MEIVVHITTEENIQNEITKITANLSNFEIDGKKLSSEEKPTSFNGRTAVWLFNNVKCNQEGKNIIQINSIDKNDISINCSVKIIVDNIGPESSIISPKKGVYLYNFKIIPFFREFQIINKTFSLGPISIRIDQPYDINGIDHVEWYLDGNLTCTVNYSKTYSWKWDKKISPKERFFNHKIKVEIYDKAKNCLELKPITIIRIF